MIITKIFMKNYTIALLSSLWLGILTNGLGQGAILVQHSGSLNPTNEGFSLGIDTGVSVGPVTNDLGMSAWTTTSTGGGLFAYVQTLTPQQQAQVAGSDWMMSVTLRVVQSSNTNSQIYTIFNTGSRAFDLGFGLNGNGDPFVEVNESSLRPVYTLTGAGSSYNNYDLLYNAANNTASLWVNGVDIIDNISGIQTPSLPVLYWGAGQDAPETYQANWNLVSLSIPEPASAAFILLGSGALIYLRRIWKVK